MQDRISEFNQDKKNYSGTLYHINDKETDPVLVKTDELYAAADALSIQNAEKHRRILLALSAVGTLLTFSFLLYDEAEMYSLILACGVLLLCLFFIHSFAYHLDCHRKYTEYRVLAEAMRVNYYLLFSGCGRSAYDLLPWSLRKGVPWVENMLSQVQQAGSLEKHSVLDCWIRDQKNYHISALKRSEIKEKRDERTSRIVVIITIAAYIAALLFEMAVYFEWQGSLPVDVIRFVLKVLLGTLSAVALFTGSYYGKMSLPQIIEDHKRMTELYEKAENDIILHGESEELIVSLARECLNENSSWYSYQSRNKPDIVL